MRGGTPSSAHLHAEAAALKSAGDDARGATAVVTLEPCAHQGKQPPCADALIKAGVRRVVAAMAEPNPIAAGGAARLRAAGIEVELGLLEREAAAQNAAFLHTARDQSRPFVALKLATTLDGRIADANGNSRWISGPEARDFVHWLRAGFDAIGVGGVTARTDDPSLTVRGPLQPRAMPVRVVFAADGDIPAGLAVVRTAREIPTVAIVSPSAKAAPGRPGRGRGDRDHPQRRSGGGARGVAQPRRGIPAGGGGRPARRGAAGGQARGPLLLGAEPALAGRRRGARGGRAAGSFHWRCRAVEGERPPLTRGGHLAGAGSRLMFTGIIEATGTVRAVVRGNDGLEMTVENPWTDVRKGESIAIDGACLTVEGLSAAALTFHIVLTSLERTKFGSYRVGRRVNLERALRVGDRLGGHMVQGHVDGVGTVISVREADDARLVDISAPPEVSRASIPLGSVTVDGVSLTVNALPAPGVIQISLIPFTLQHTTLDSLRTGDRVHLEADVIGKYVRHLMAGNREP